MSSIIKQRMFSTQLDYGRHELGRVGLELGFVIRVSSNKWPSVVTPVSTIGGIVDGIAVAVQRFPRKHGFVDRAAAAIWPPLDLGVSLRLEGRLVGAVRDLFGSEDVQTGDEAFDKPLRIQADEARRVVALLASADLRHRLHWFAGSCESFELTDAGIRCGSSSHHGPRNWKTDVPALVDVARSLRAATKAVAPASALTPWADALRPIAATYGLVMRSCPLGAEGDLDDLRCGIFFRRLADRRYAVELGAVIGPLDPFQISMQPRRPKIDVEPFELSKPLERPKRVPALDGEDPRLAKTFVTEAVRASPHDVERAIPREVRAKMLELQQTFDVGIRHGVLSIRRAIEPGDDPTQLARWIDAAADGARLVVRRASSGYR